MTHPWQPAKDRRPYWEDGLRWGRVADGELAVGLLRWLRADDNTENRWFLLFRRLGEDQVHFVPVLSQTIITSSPGSNQTITSDATWNNNSNSVEVLAGGGGGTSGAVANRWAGGAGAYTKIVNFQFATPGTTQATLQVGVGGAAVAAGVTTGNPGGDSWFNNTVYPTTGTGAGAKAGLGGTSTAAGAGGLASGAYDNPSANAVTSSGGSGSGGSATQGGGGAGGPHGAGSAGSTTSGGAADGGTVAGPTVAANGNSGTEFDSTHGCGTGAYATAGIQFNGGNYGGGAVGGNPSHASGAGAQGIVVLNWTAGVAMAFFSDLSAENVHYIVKSLRLVPYR